MRWTSTTARETIAAVDARRQGDGREKLLMGAYSLSRDRGRGDWHRCTLNKQVRTKQLFRDSSCFFDREDMLRREMLPFTNPAPDCALGYTQDTTECRLRACNLDCSLQSLIWRWGLIRVHHGN